MTFPDVDSTKFNSKMQVDWTRFVFETAAPTDAQGLPPRLRKALGVENTGFNKLNHLPGGKATKFSVNVQDPKGPARLQEVEAGLIKHCGVVGRPVLDAWEVTLDAIPKKGAGVTRRQAAEMAVFLALTCAYRFPDGYSIRIYRKRGAEVVPSTIEQVVQALEGGYSFAIGNQRYDSKRHVPATPIAMRAYLKERDNGEDLNEGKFFARIEFTFQHEAFAFRHPEEMNDFNFADWNRENGFFNFRLPDVERWNPYALATLGHAIPQRFATTNDTRRKHKRGTKANTRLNRTVKDAAVALTNRWAKHPACRNSTILESENLATVRDERGFTNNSPFNVNNPDNLTPSFTTYDSHNTKNIPSLNDTGNNHSYNEEEQFFSKIVGAAHADEQPLTVEAVFDEFINLPDTEEDQRIARMFDDILSEQSSTSSLSICRPTFPSLRFFSNANNRFVFDDFSIASYGNIRDAARLHGSKLIELFSAKPP